MSIHCHEQPSLLEFKNTFQTTFEERKQERTKLSKDKTGNFQDCNGQVSKISRNKFKNNFSRREENIAVAPFVFAKKCLLLLFIWTLHPSLLGEMETENLKLNDALYINDKRGNEFLESRQRIATNYFPIRQVYAYTAAVG